MRYLILMTLLLMQFKVFANSESKAFPICSLYYLDSVTTKVQKMGSYDKFKHCAVSCLLALKCPPEDVLEIGILKELADVFGPGNAEMEDLEADFKGVELVLQKKATSEPTCHLQCNKHYPKNKCR